MTIFWVTSRLRTKDAQRKIQSQLIANCLFPSLLLCKENARECDPSKHLSRVICNQNMRTARDDSLLFGKIMEYQVIFTKHKAVASVMERVADSFEHNMMEQMWSDDAWAVTRQFIRFHLMTLAPHLKLIYSLGSLRIANVKFCSGNNKN